MMAWLNSAAIKCGDGTFISWGWFIGTALAWALIPGAYILKAVEERHRRRIWAETQPIIDAGIRDLERECAKAGIKK